jgi:hypothetical protein
MARFRVIRASEANVLNGPRQFLTCGRTIADTQGNAVPGDVVCPQLCNAPHTGLVALDASAVSAFASVGITAVIGQYLCSVTGIDGVGA